VKKINSLIDYSPMSARSHDNAPNAKTHGVEIMRAGDLVPKKLVRLWAGRFYRGKLGFIAGDPGVGKSQIATLYGCEGVSRRGMAAWRGHCSPRRRDPHHRGGRRTLFARGSKLPTLTSTVCTSSNV
jgi:hypothetical protein